MVACRGGRSVDLPSAKYGVARHTATVCDNAPPPYSLYALLFDKPAQCVKCSSCLERPDSLLVLALEKQSDLRVRFVLRDLHILVFSIWRLFGDSVMAIARHSFGLRGRGKGIERFGCRHGREVDVLLYSFTGDFYGVAGERRTCCDIRHIWRSDVRFVVAARKSISTSPNCCCTRPRLPDRARKVDPTDILHVIPICSIWRCKRDRHGDIAYRMFSGFCRLFETFHCRKVMPYPSLGRSCAVAGDW
jgi:hypothetical protein